MVKYPYGDPKPAASLRIPWSAHRDWALTGRFRGVEGAREGSELFRESCESRAVR